MPARPPLALLLYIAACGSTDTPTLEPCDENGKCPVGFTCVTEDHLCHKSSAAVGDAAPADAPVSLCPAIDGLPGASGPTTHGGGELTADETWTAAGSPHIVTGQVRVGGSATLTIAPCAEVSLAPMASVVVALQRTPARLVAEGTAAQPIHFHARDAGQPWSYLLAYSPGTISLVHAELEGGGADRFQGYATIIALGDSVSPMKKILHVDHVTVNGSQGPGVRLTALGAFADGSTDLTISGCGAFADAPGNPVLAGVHEAGTIPSGVYTGNRQDTLAIDGDTEVSEDLTLADRGVPYETGSNADIRVHGATLTIAAGVELRMSALRNVVIGISPSTGGALVTAGTAEKPVRIVAATADHWANITAQYPGTLSLSHTLLENGGDDRFRAGATIVAWGDNVPPLKKNLSVDHVTIQKSLGVGMLVDRQAAFADGSTDLTVTASGGDLGAYPVQIATPAVGTLPPGSYTGNLVDEIYVDTAHSVLDADTFHAYGVPYRIKLSLHVLAASVAPPAPPPAKLTIEPGTTLRFEPSGALIVGAGAATGVLVADGTAEQPIVFTAASDAPAPGFWRGLVFSAYPTSGSSISYARIEYAGADCLCSGFSCSAFGEAGVGFFGDRPDSELITHTTFAHIAGHGVLSGWRSDLDGPDFKPTNTFTDVSRCPQARWKTSTNMCAGSECY